MGFKKVLRTEHYCPNTKRHVKFFPTYVAIEKLPQIFRDGRFLLVPHIGERSTVSRVRNNAPSISWPSDLKPGIHIGSFVKNSKRDGFHFVPSKMKAQT